MRAKILWNPYDIHIPHIIASNPRVVIWHDRGPWSLVFSSTAGGSVVSPGEGEFISSDGQPVYVEAKPYPGFLFVNFSGTYSTSENPFSFMPNYNHNIRANFVSTSDVLYVDDNAPADPGPHNPTVSDSQENGTREHPFDCIQEAIEVTGDGAAVFVHGGIYRETIDLLGKRITVTGFDPNDPADSAWPVIDGGGNGPVVRFTQGEDESCVLSGFVITGGKGRTAAAVRCAGSRPTIANCLIAGNRATEYNGASVVCTDSNAVFINCTIADNRGGQFGAGLSSVNSELTVINSILWSNYPKEIMSEGGYLPAIHYSTVAGGWLGVGNLTADPLFAGLGRWVDQDNPAVTMSPSDPGATWAMGDYHLQSKTGRWDPKTGDWKQDVVTSPCIDGGDPTLPVGLEPLPNGQIINMGAYGGTAQASKSFSTVASP